MTTMRLLCVVVGLFLFLGLEASLVLGSSSLISGSSSSNNLKVSEFDFYPQQVHLALTSSPSSMTVTWVTTAAVERPVARFRKVIGGQQQRKEVRATTHTYTEGGWVGFIHDALLIDLEPNSLYSYQVGDETTDTWSSSFQFTTPKQDPTEINFVAFGDSGVFNSSRNLFRKLGDIKRSLDFVIHVGDFGYNKEKGKWGIQYEEYALQKQQTWDEWFNMIEPVSSSVPYMVCPGNHETGRFDFNYIPYSQRFAMPGQNDFYYSFNYGPIHFVALSTDQDYEPQSEQMKWLEKDLSSVKRDEYPWVIVYLHRPMYSSSPEDGSNMNLRAAVEPMLVKHKVDLVFSGHDHSYERTYPVADGVPDTNSGTGSEFLNPPLPIHVRVGTGGIELTPEFDPWPSWSIFRQGLHHGFAVVSLNTETQTLRVEFLSTTDSSVKDQFQIRKGAPKASSGSSLFWLICVLGVVIIAAVVFNQRRRRVNFRL